VARGTKGAIPQKFLENTVILCFAGRFSKENSVIRLKSNILPLPKNFWAGHATDDCATQALTYTCDRPVSAQKICGSVATGVSLVNVRLLPFQHQTTYDFYVMQLNIS